MSPKRAPAGQCKVCNASIVARKVYCETCLKKRQLETETAKKLPQVRLDKETVFTCLSKKIDKNENVGFFLDVFEQLTGQLPPYLTSGDWQRHFDYVQQLRQFACYTQAWNRQREERQAIDFPIEDLSYVLREWIRSAACHFRLETEPLLRFGWVAGC